MFSMGVPQCLEPGPKQLSAPLHPFASPTACTSSVNHSVAEVLATPDILFLPFLNDGQTWAKPGAQSVLCWLSGITT